MKREGNESYNNVRDKKVREGNRTGNEMDEREREGR